MNSQLSIEYRMDTGLDPRKKPYIAWLEEKYITLRDKKPEKKYFLIGIEGVKAYNGEYCDEEETGADAVARAYEDHQITYATAMYDGSNILEVLQEIQGAFEWILIDEHEYSKL